MSDFITSVKDQIFAYIAFHSYSQVILFPYGHTDDRVDNYADLMQIGNVSASALAKRHGTRYKVGNLVDILCEFLKQITFRLCLLNLFTIFHVSRLSSSLFKLKTTAWML